MQLEDGC